MSMVLFINSKSALGIAGVTLAGAALFAVVSGFEGTVLNNSGQEQSATPAPVAAQEPAAPPPAFDEPQPEIADFAPDEDLIDDTSGFDPSPRDTVEIIEPETAESSSFGSDPDSESGSDTSAPGQSPKEMAATAPKPKRSYSKGGTASGMASLPPRSPPSGAKPIVVN